MLHGYASRTHDARFFCKMERETLVQSINDILREDQNVLTVSPDTLVTSALDMMNRHHFSQLPVVRDGRVAGMFSFESFANQLIALLAKHGQLLGSPEDLVVDDFKSETRFISVDAPLEGSFSDLNEVSAVVAGSRDNLQGIITPMDVLHHLHAVSQPFVLVSEIERHIRSLITACTQPDELGECIERALLNSPYPPERLPSDVTEMTMGDYLSIVRHGENWSAHFGDAFSEGGSSIQRKIVGGHLDEIRELRNVIYHRKRSIMDEDIKSLKEHRTWIRGRLEAYNSSRRH